jgi:RNA recognition motif-containing protein
MNIYVGNLSRQAGESDLRTLFSEFGEVKSIKIIKDNISGESRGFAFVEMPDPTQATLAVREVNAQEFDGRRLKVNEAKPKTGAKIYNSFSSNYGYRDRNDHY